MLLVFSFASSIKPAVPSAFVYLKHIPSSRIAFNECPLVYPLQKAPRPIRPPKLSRLPEREPRKRRDEDEARTRLTLSLFWRLGCLSVIPGRSPSRRSRCPFYTSFECRFPTYLLFSGAFLSTGCSCILRTSLRPTRALVLYRYDSCTTCPPARPIF